MTEGLRYAVRDRIATITLERPERRNAFTLEMVDAWAAAIDTAEANPEVRVVVVTGRDGSFCSGVDLSVLDGVEATPLAHRRLLTDRVHKVALAASRLSKPMIAAINGLAVGAGLDMALLCDLRFAARSARLSAGYIRAGLVPGDGGAWLLPRLVGPGKAMELLLTGDFVDAEEALRIGLVERVYGDDELLERVAEFAKQLRGRSPLGLSVIKRAVRQAEGTDLFTALDAMSSHLAVVLATEDYQVARAAVRTGEEPDFTGR